MPATLSVRSARRASNRNPRHRAGRRLPAVGVPPGRGARTRRLGPQRRERRHHRSVRAVAGARRLRRGIAAHSPARRAHRRTHRRSNRLAPGVGVRHRGVGALVRPARVDSRGPGHLPGLPARDSRPGRPSLRVSLHELHELRPAFHHRDRHSVRPPEHDDGPVRDVPRVPGGIRVAVGPALPRAAQCVPGLRPETLARRPGWSARSPRPTRSRRRPRPSVAASCSP